MVVIMVLFVLSGVALCKGNEFLYESMGKLNEEVEIVEWMDDVRRTVPKFDRWGSRLGLDTENEEQGLTKGGKICIESVPLTETGK